MIKSKFFITVILAQILILSCLFGYSLYVESGLDNELRGKSELVKHLGLTDYAIWTEARYTRHPSQADLFSPFQDFPASLEHFPAGSIIAPVNPYIAGGP